MTHIRVMDLAAPPTIPPPSPLGLLPDRSHRAVSLWAIGLFATAAACAHGLEPAPATGSPSGTAPAPRAGDGDALPPPVDSCPRSGSGFTEVITAQTGDTLQSILERSGYLDTGTPNAVLHCVAALNPWPPDQRLDPGVFVRLPFKKCLAREPPPVPELCDGGWTRSLSFFNLRARPYDVRSLIAEALRAHPDETLRVLEIGAGMGRLLLTLQQDFPEAQFVGINKESRPFLSTQQDLLRVAAFFDIQVSEPTGALHLPELHFEDLSDGWLERFPTRSFQLVLSQSTLRYLERKDRIIEEVWRLLKPGGIALLHIGLMYLHQCGRDVPLEALWLALRRNGFEVKKVRPESNMVVVYKNVEQPLALPVRFLPQLSYASRKPRTLGWVSHFELLDGPPCEPAQNP